MPEHILFVDDEPDLEPMIRQRYRKLIRRGEFVHDFAESGREALDFLADNDACSLVMTDINMPEMSGLQLVEEIKRRHPERILLIVIISAYSDWANIETAMNLGAFGFVTKPIDFEKLETTRQKALNHILSLREKERLAEEKHTLQEKNAFIREVFGRYLSDSIVEVLLESRDGLKLGGERRSVAMLMSDLRGFSVLAERHAAEQIISTLNHYFSVMIDIVLEYGGIIDEIQGDSILAIFGAPLHQDDSAQRAAACAIAMQQAMDSVNAYNLERNLPSISMGVAVHTGEVVLGNIGSDKRTKYGVVGSEVNLTARIQSRAIGGQVLVSESAVDACHPHLEVGGSVEFRAKGFERQVQVFDLRGIRGRYHLSLPDHSLSLVELENGMPIEFMSAVECGDNSWRVGSIHGLSVAGIEIYGTHSLEAADTVIVRFPNGDLPAPISLYTKVVDCDRDDRFRAWFVALSRETTKYLEDLIASHGAVPLD